MSEFCSSNTSSSSPHWTFFDATMWKVFPESWGGGRQRLRDYKDAFVIHNKQAIKDAAIRYRLPPELVAGTCWAEAGGMPDFMDSTAFNVRAFENNYMFGWLSPPEKTSFGWVSVQLRTAARTLGLDPSTMSQDQFRELSLCLERDSYNIDLAARHLRQLADHDGYQTVGFEEVRVIGARYNRGMDISMQAVMRDTSYGDNIVKKWQHLHQLIQ